MVKSTRKLPIQKSFISPKHSDITTRFLATLGVNSPANEVERLPAIHKKPPGLRSSVTLDMSGMSSRASLSPSSGKGKSLQLKKYSSLSGKLRPPPPPADLKIKRLSKGSFATMDKREDTKRDGGVRSPKGNNARLQPLGRLSRFVGESSGVVAKLYSKSRRKIFM